MKNYLTLPYGQWTMIDSLVFTAIVFPIACCLVFILAKYFDNFVRRGFNAAMKADRKKLKAGNK